MQLIKDLNTFFIKDKTYGINKLFNEIARLSKGGTKSFKLSRKYYISGLSENNTRKVLEILTKYGFLKRYISYGNMIVSKNGKVCKKTVYNYTIPEKFIRIIKKIAKKLKITSNYIKLSNDNTIHQVKTILKNIYKNIKFKKNKFGNTLFILYGRQYAIGKMKNTKEIYIVDYIGGVSKWITFYYTNIAKT